MKSFSSSVKDYLCEKSLEELGIGENSKVKWKECCTRSFLRAVFLFLCKVESESEVISSDREALLEVTEFLLIRCFDLEGAVAPRKVGNRKGASLVFPLGTREFVLKNTQSFHEEACERCRILYIRAAFLCHGTILDPMKGYHAALSVSDEEAALELCGVMEQFDLIPKKLRDEKGVLLYFKESGKVEDFLSVLGAQRFALSLMNQRIDKNLRLNINRRLNFDGANMKKTVNSAQNIISAIRYLQDEGILQTLSEPLQKAAKLRLSYPEVSLGELVHFSEEKITKSGLNHRFQKLVALAEKQKNEGNEI